MNKNRYRIIFSQLHQCLIAVSELARCVGKAVSDVIENSTQKVRSIFTALLGGVALRPLAWFMMKTLGFVFVIGSIQAETLIIKADPTAAANQQPIVLQAANGVPQVNIQTPNTHGLSHNKYHSFDVDRQGAILNNSRKDVQTQLGGWVQGNPYLAGGEAKVIVNEVNSQRPSQLKGYVEVAGKKADVIIANPNGLHCDGCGVINAERATFTTGNPELIDGSLEGFVVERGKVSVLGKGMDNRQTDYTEILARSAEINAGIWSKKAVKVVTGQNRISKDADAVQIIHQTNDVEKQSQNTPHFAVDVSELGGMYADKIHLIGTEAGLGVRNAGHIGAEADSVVIDVNGNIINQGQLQAQQAIHVTAKGENGVIENQGKLFSLGETAITSGELRNQASGQILGSQTQLHTSQKLTNRGIIKGSEHLQAKSAGTLENLGTGRIYGGKISLQARHLVNRDEIDGSGVSAPVIAALGRLDIAAERIENRKDQFLVGDIHYQGGNIGTTISSAQSAVTFGRVLDEHGRAMGNAASLLNHGGLIEGNGIDLKADSITNSNARLITSFDIISDTPIAEHYLLPENAPMAERIDFNQLQWVGFSRAGKVVYKPNTNIGQNPDTELATTLLPMPNEENCADEQRRTGCVANPNALYGEDSPIWSYFNLTPPSNAPDVGDLSRFASVLNEPEKPDMPTRLRYESEASYQTRLTQYQQELANYQLHQTEYDRQFEQYQSVLQPYLDWVEVNKERFESLNEKILAHNRRLYGKEFYRFWDIYFNRRLIQETRVKDSNPGRIISTDSIAINGELHNNRSQVLAANAITSSGLHPILNEDEIGLHQEDEFGNHAFTYSRWRGGFRRYFERKWTGRGDFTHTDKQEISLNEAQTQAHTEVNPQAENAEIQLPVSSLYLVNPNSPNNVLVETDPAFTDRRQWLSGDYMFNALRADHNLVHKRLGDGYYEQRLVRDQINQLTGRVFLGDHQDFDSQYKTLMDNGITFAKRFNLRLGIGLSPEQVKQLTSDMVWFETQSVTLPDGSQQTMLVPRVYVMAQKENNSDHSKTGIINGLGVISAKNLQLNTSEFTNSGMLLGQESTVIQAQNINNQGAIRGKHLIAHASQNFHNLGGSFIGKNLTQLTAGNEFISNSTTIDSENTHQKSTALSRQAQLVNKGKDGELLVQANNMNINGTHIINQGQETFLIAKNNLNLGTVQTDSHETLGAGNHRRTETHKNTIGSQVHSAGDLYLQSQNMHLQGANLDATKRLQLLAENNLVLSAAENRQGLEEYHKTQSGTVARTTRERFHQHESRTQLGTRLNAQDINLQAGNDIQATVANIVADKDVDVRAGNNIRLEAGANHQRQIAWEKKKTSGVFAGGGLGVTFGSKSEKHQYELEGWTQSDARSTLGSLNGNIAIQAGNQATILGSEIIGKNDRALSIRSGKITLEAGQDKLIQQERHEYKQAGLTMALSTPVTDAAFAMHNSLQRSKQVKNDKLKALYQVKAATEAAKAAKAFNGVDGLSNTLSAMLNDGKMEKGDVSSPSVKLSISLGASQSKQTSRTETLTHVATELNGGNVQLTSTKQDIDLKGSNINGNQVSLDSARDIHLTSVQDLYQNRSKNSSHGWSVGVFLGYTGNSFGLGVEGSVQGAKGRENSDSQTQRNSQINGNYVEIKSQRDTTLKGAVVNADKLHTKIGNNLTIESRQDSTQFDSKQTQASAGASVAIYGNGSSANVNFAKNNAKMHRTQVEEQSGFKVGDGGVNVNVQNHTHLKGGLVESTADLGKNNFTTNSLTTENIENHSEVKVQSVSGGLSTNMAQMAIQGAAAAASMLGNKHESDKTTTHSAIGENIDLQVKTGKIATALSRDPKNANEKVKTFDINEIKEQQEAGQVIGEIVKNTIDLTLGDKLKQAEKDKREAQATLKDENATTAQKIAAEAQLNTANQTLEKYSVSSDLQLAIRAATGALQGIVAKDAGQAIVGGLSPFANKFIKEQTKDNTTANLMAHALLGAIEAKATGNNALAGATAGVVGESSAMLITEKLYNKRPEDLTEQEKQTVTVLSSIASAFSAGAVGDSTASGLSGMEIGKRAVENNVLGPISDNEYWTLLEKIARGEKLTHKENLRFKEYSQADHNSDFLIDKYRSGKPLTEKEARSLSQHLAQYVAESRFKGVPEAEIEKNINSLLTENSYRRYSEAYALKPEYRQQLPDNWDMTLTPWSKDKTLDHQYYDQIIRSNRTKEIYENSFDGKAAQSTMEGLVMVGGNGNAIMKFGQTMDKALALIEANALKTSVKVEQGLVRAVERVTKAHVDGTIYAGDKINSGLVQINNTVKKMTHASPTAIKSSMTSATIISGSFETYEYGTGKKQFTTQNLINSATSVTKDSLTNSLTTNAGFVSSIAISASIDYLYSHDSNLYGNIRSSTIGHSIDELNYNTKYKGFGYNLLKDGATKFSSEVFKKENEQ